MAYIVAVANQKGGVGKTTSTINLAYALANKKKRVLAIDADPQANLTMYFGYDAEKLEDKEQTLYFSLIKGKPLSALGVGDNPSLIPSSIGLANAEPELISNLLKAPQTVLRDRLKELRDSYDFVFIDCMPSLGLLTINALTAADLVLIPSETEYLASKGIQLLFRTVTEVRDGLNPHLRIFGVLPTKYNQRYSHDNVVLQGVQEGVSGLGIRVFDPVPRSTSFSKASIESKATVVLTPETPGAQVYHQLADHLIAYGH